MLCCPPTWGTSFPPRRLSESCDSACFLHNNLGKENTFKILNQAGVLRSRCNEDVQVECFETHGVSKSAFQVGSMNPYSPQSPSPSLWSQIRKFSSPDPGPRRVLTLQSAHGPNTEGFNCGRGQSMFIVNHCLMQIEGRKGSLPPKGIQL